MRVDVDKIEPIRFAGDEVHKGMVLYVELSDELRNTRE